MYCFADTFHWPHEAILLLLSIYVEHEHLIKSGKISMKKLWSIVSSKLNEKTYNVTDVQCKSKMNSLKNTYKSVKDHNAKSGNNHRRWKYFDVSIKYILYDKYYFYYVCSKNHESNLSRKVCCIYYNYIVLYTYLFYMIYQYFFVA